MKEIPQKYRDDASDYDGLKIREGYPESVKNETSKSTPGKGKTKRRTAYNGSERISVEETEDHAE